MSPFRLLAVAALALAGAPALAGEEVLVFKTQESDDVEKTCLSHQNIRLGAYVYAPRTRGSDGKVVREFGSPIGTVVGCGTLTSTALHATAPFSMDFDLGGRRIFAAGSCEVTQRYQPNGEGTPPVLLVGCSLAVEPSAEEPELAGIATSASIFNLYRVEGFETGSYWTLHLFQAK